MPSTAANIPPELFDDILWYIPPFRYIDGLGLGLGAYRALPESKEEKSHLSLCSLVCRHWARLCRPHIFAYVRLRCSDDLHAFKRILLMPPPARLPSIAEYVKHVHIFVERIEPPWVHHLLPSYCQRILLLNCNFTLTVKASSSKSNDTTMPFAAIYSPLPHTLPSVHACLTHLNLQNIHFRNATAFCRVISGFRNLEDLRIYDLTWDAAPLEDLALASSVPVFPRLSFLYIENPKGDALPMWLLPASGKASPFGDALDDSSRLVRLFECLRDESGYKSLVGTTYYEGGRGECYAFVLLFVCTVR
jgi:hypothetical protein